MAMMVMVLPIGAVNDTVHFQSSEAVNHTQKRRIFETLDTVRENIGVGCNIEDFENLTEIM